MLLFLRQQQRGARETVSTLQHHVQCISRPQCCRAECCRAETRGWCRLQSPGCCSTAPESGYCSCCRGRPVLGHSELQCGQLVSTSQDIFRVPGLNIVPKSLPKIHDIYVPKSKYHSRAGGSSRQRFTLCHVPAAGPGRVRPLLQWPPLSRPAALQHCSASRVFGTEGTDTSILGWTDNQ